MSSSYKNNISIQFFGESHEKTMGVIIEGLPSGITLDLTFINLELSRRRPLKDLSTKRVEKDHFEIVSGYFNDKTTGTPLCILVFNEEFQINDYSFNQIRPSHIDYVTFKKYQGYFDYRGSGHFSGRLSVLMVIAGAIFKQLLKKQDIYIISHIKQIKNILDDDFSYDIINKQIKQLEKETFPVLNLNAKNQMIEIIKNTSLCKDSIGGIVQTLIYNLPVGIGEPLFDSLESQLSKFIFSIPAIKGISFGLGFDYVHFTGSQVNDPFYFDKGQVKTLTNNNGGINGGISNGMPIIFDCIVKPTPSIGLKQQTIDLKTKQNTTIEINGRHDPAIISRICVIIEAMSAIALYDLLIEQQKRER